MRHVAALILCVLGGNTTPSADDIAKVVQSVGGEVDNAKVEQLLKELEGKDISEVVEAGKKKLASVVVGGGAGPAAGGAAASAGGAAAAAEEEEEEEEEEAVDLGGGMDMFGGGDDDY